jgi:hypothetical protein
VRAPTHADPCEPDRARETPYPDTYPAISGTRPSDRIPELSLAPGIRSREPGSHDFAAKADHAKLAFNDKPPQNKFPLSP